MNCKRVLDMVYDSDDELPLLNQIQIWLHAFFCQECADKIEQYQNAKMIMKEEFFPSLPASGNTWSDIEDSIMVKINSEHAEEDETAEHVFSPHGGFSTRGWIITGLVILVSMVTAFLGLDFQKLANEYGMSFMLPMGITIGIVLTTYGALFIGSHLKEFSERFDN